MGRKLSYVDRVDKIMTVNEALKDIIWAEVSTLGQCVCASDCGLNLQQAVNLTLFRFIPGNRASTTPRGNYIQERSYWMCSPHRLFCG